MLIFEFFGFSISATVPDGPSYAATALPSTMVMSPPPLPAIGSAFIAGFGRTMVWRLPLPEEASFCFSGAWSTEETRSPKTEARAVAGKSVPRISSSEMRVAAVPVDLDEAYFIARGCALSGNESL